MIFLILLFCLLLLCSAFFSSSETALFSLSRIQRLRLQGHSKKGSKTLASLLKNPRSILITILLGNEFANVCISITGAAIIGRLVETSAQGESVIAIAVITPIVLIFGEIMPKITALKLAWKLSPRISKPLLIFHKLVSPIRKVLLAFSDAIIKIVGGNPFTSSPVIMEEEYRRLIDQSIQHGTIYEQERRMIHSVFEFSDKLAKEIMTPSNHIFSLPINISYSDLFEKIKNCPYTRIPFFKDTNDNIAGILHKRDFFAYHRKKNKASLFNIQTILREAHYVAPDETLDELLHLFQAYKSHLALVKYRKKILGVVTLDDVLDEIFGNVGK